MRPRRCDSRLWTPEFGATAWLTCERRGSHRGAHRAAGAAWQPDEAMPAVTNDHPERRAVAHLRVFRHARPA